MNFIFGTVILFVLITLCCIGLYHSYYDDNLAQCVGIVMVLLWAIATLGKTVSLHYAATSDTFLVTGLVIFASGVAVRTYLYKRKRG
jgi:hypothetical protein